MLSLLQPRFNPWELRSQKLHSMAINTNLKKNKMLILWSGDTDQEYRCCPSCIVDEAEPDLKTEMERYSVYVCVGEGWEEDQLPAL